MSACEPEAAAHSSEAGRCASWHLELCDSGVHRTDFNVCNKYEKQVFGERVSLIELPKSFM